MMLQPEHVESKKYKQFPRTVNKGGMGGIKKKRL